MRGNQTYLVTYRWDEGGVVGYGHDLTDDPAQWLADTNDDCPGTYILINVLEVSHDWAAKYDGELKGM